VRRMVLVARHQPSQVLQPREHAFHLPSTHVTPQLPSVLGLLALATVRRNQLGAVLLKQPHIQPVAVVSLVADQHRGRKRDHQRVEGLFHQLYFVRRRAFDVDAHRSTMAVRDCHDLCALSTLGFADLVAPFFAGTKLPSMKASDTSMEPRSARSSASLRMIFSMVPARVHCWNHRCNVWTGGYWLGWS